MVFIVIFIGHCMYELCLFIHFLLIEIKIVSNFLVNLYKLLQNNVVFIYNVCNEKLLNFVHLSCSISCYKYTQLSVIIIGLIFNCTSQFDNFNLFLQMYLKIRIILKYIM